MLKYQTVQESHRYQDSSYMLENFVVHKQLDLFQQDFQVNIPYLTFIPMLMLKKHFKLEFLSTKLILTCVYSFRIIQIVLTICLKLTSLKQQIWDRLAHQQTVIYIIYITEISNIMSQNHIIQQEDSVSFGSQKHEHKQQEKQINFQRNILRYSSQNTLRLSHLNNNFIQTDQQFIKDVQNIAKLQHNIIQNFIEFTKHQILDDQCDEINYQALIHYEANGLNKNTILDYDNVQSSLRCNCGCKRVKGEQLSIFADLNQMQALGPGVQLFFIYLKFLIGMFLIIVLVYGIFALVINLMGNSANTTDCEDFYCKFRKISSIQNNNNSKYIYVEHWLGVVISVIWVFLIRVLKFIGKRVNKFMDKKFKTAADFSIKIQNLPYGYYSEEQLIEYFQRLWKKYNKQQQIEQPSHIQQHEYNNPFGMKNIQIVYNMQFSRKMISQILMQSEIVYDLILKDKQTNKKNVVKDVESYKMAKIKLIQNYQLLQDLRKKFLTDSNFRKSISTTCCLIQFNNEEKCKEMLQKHGRNKAGLLKQIQERTKQSIIKKCFNKSDNTLFKGNVISIERAPEPSDIQWINCQKRYSIVRIGLIYLITILIILVSFGIVAGLDATQQYYMSNKQETSSRTLTIINIITSLCLMLVNNFLWFSLFYLLELQYNHTVTQKIMSQMNKTLIASSINIIVLPIISSYVLRGKLFGTGGLEGMVFDYQVSMLTVNLIVRLLNPPQLLKRLALWFRYTRNIIIRFICAKIEKQSQIQEVSKFYEGSKFDLADYYVTIICAIYHAVFFMQIQPTIIFVSFFMLFGLYWVLKIKIIKFSKLPEITDFIVFESALSQANLVPMMYGIGSIVLSFIENRNNTQKQFIYIQPIICMCISAIAFGNPGDFMNRIIIYFANYFVSDIPKDKDQKIIKQDYFSHSNALVLLGFEYKIKGRSQKPVQNELKLFCQSFIVPSYMDELSVLANKVLININNNIGGFGFPISNSRRPLVGINIKKFVKEEDQKN